MSLKKIALKLFYLLFFFSGTIASAAGDLSFASAGMIISNAVVRKVTRSKY
jgi:hypothetical protein